MVQLTPLTVEEVELLMRLRGKASDIGPVHYTYFDRGMLDWASAVEEPDKQFYEAAYADMPKVKELVTLYNDLQQNARTLAQALQSVQDAGFTFNPSVLAAMKAVSQ